MTGPSKRAMDEVCGECGGEGTEWCDSGLDPVECDECAGTGVPAEVHVPQPSASDEETAREISDGAHEIVYETLEAHGLAHVDALRVALAGEVVAFVAQALAQARRQGAAAMRERCADACKAAFDKAGDEVEEFPRTSKFVDEDDNYGNRTRAEGKRFGAHCCLAAIRALPDEGK